MYFEKKNDKQKTLDIIALLRPKDWGTEKDSVTLVKEARNARAKQLINNSTDNA